MVKNIGGDKIDPKNMWTLENIYKSRHVNKFLDALDRFVDLNKTPNPIRRTGILLRGPHGSGKTTIVRAAMKDKYYMQHFAYIEIGGVLTGYDHKEVDKQVEELFSDASTQATMVGRPYVLYADEIGSTISTRNRSSRVQKILVDAILRCLTKYNNVLFIGSVNDTSETDSSVIGSGRFTKIDFDIATTPEERTAMLRVHMNIPLSYLTFDDKITNNLLEYETYHVSWSGRDYEDWTQDVSVYCYRNDISKITREVFINTLEKRRLEIYGQKEKDKEDGVECSKCGGSNTIKMGVLRGRPRRLCKDCNKTFYTIEVPSDENGEQIADYNTSKEIDSIFKNLTK